MKVKLELELTFGWYNKYLFYTQARETGNYLYEPVSFQRPRRRVTYKNCSHTPVFFFNPQNYFRTRASATDILAITQKIRLNHVFFSSCHLVNFETH